MCKHFLSFDVYNPPFAPTAVLLRVLSATKTEDSFFLFFQIRSLLLLGKIPEVSLSGAPPGRLGRRYILTHAA